MSSSPSTPTTTSAEHALGRALDKVLDKATRRRGGFGPPTVLVDSPTLGVHYAYGEHDRPFHGASVGKAVAAAVAGQLVDERVLAPDTRVAEVLPGGLLDGLYVRRGVDRAGEVTLEHLLAHTSGLDDFFEGRPNLQGRLLARPDEFWTAEALLDWVRDNQAPFADPGERYRYSDTGYSVLWLVLEAVTGRSYADLVHERVFAPLGMRHARIHLRSAPAEGVAPVGPLPAGPVESDIAPLWLDGVEASRFQSVSIDAGPQGGLVATPAEAAAFARALVSGDLVSPPTLAWLRRPRHRFRWGIHYGAGLMEVRMRELAPFMGGVPPAIGHIGILATHAYHVPGFDADIVLNFHSTSEMGRSFRVLAAVLQQLRRLDRG